MPKQETVSRYLRVLFRAVAVYAAGAWVAIEVVDFAVRQYGLSQFLVDAAVVVAFGGGMVTAVLVWFHGESGRQEFQIREFLVICGIVVATASVLFYLSSGGPTRAFDKLPGYRLILEFRYSTKEDSDHFQIAMGPIEAIEPIPGGMMSLGAEGGRISGPIIHGEFEGHPTMFVDSPESDFARIIFILPYEPADLSDLAALGTAHDGIAIVTAGLNIQIETSVVIEKQENGATIQILRTEGNSEE